MTTANPMSKYFRKALGDDCKNERDTRLYKPGIHTVTFRDGYCSITRKIEVFLQEMYNDYGNGFKILVQTSVSTYFEEYVSITFKCG